MSDLRASAAGEDVAEAFGTGRQGVDGGGRGGDGLKRGIRSHTYQNPRRRNAGDDITNRGAKEAPASPTFRRPRETVASLQTVVVSRYCLRASARSPIHSSNVSARNKRDINRQRDNQRDEHYCTYASKQRINISQSSVEQDSS